jgi:ribosomal protein L29
MATVKKRELAQMTIDQLNIKNLELKKELMKLNMQRSTGTPPENPGLVRTTRRTIARINTYITQKQKQPKKVPETKTSQSKKSTKKKQEVSSR